MPTAAVVALVAVAVVTTHLIAWRFVAALRARADAPPPRRDDEVFASPVRELMLRGGWPSFGMSRNGVSPRLAVTRRALRFKVFGEREWAFAEIDRVDLRRALVGSSVVFSGGGGTLVATLADRAAIRTLLRALPRTLPLTAPAAALRDAA